MSSFNVVVDCPVYNSFRVEQVAGMFDVPLCEKATERFQVELPTDDATWQIGLIVGPSGSGKSTVARHAFANELYQEQAWPADRAVIDCFDELPIRDLVALFTAVGFGSPPSWIKPYRVLSCGEQFRCNLARALSTGFNTPGKAGGCRTESPSSVADDLRKSAPGSAGGFPLVVYDEFTSVVDRTVAKVCSAAIAKGIRCGHLPCRFVAVTCHYDVAEWLEPDWVLDMATQQLFTRPTNGSEVSGVGCQVSGKTDTRNLTPDTWFRRPPIELQIHRSRLAAWELFKRHHYLTGTLAPQARCYVTTWNGVPVNFCATLPVIAKRNHRRFTRIVTLPDFQGLGIGMRAMAAVAELHRQEGFRINVTSSHPTLIRHCQRSPLWKAVDVKKSGTARSAAKCFAHYRSSAGRAVVSFEYVGG